MIGEINRVVVIHSILVYIRWRIQKRKISNEKTPKKGQVQTLMPYSAFYYLQ